LVTEFEPIAKSSNIKLITDFAPNLPKVTGDPFQILQVLENLLYNAIRYIGDPTEAKQSQIILKLFQEGKYVTCQVIDNGVGIPQDDQKYIFQKFFRADNARRYQTSGSGLGLYISKNIIEKSGGKIGFVSCEGKGSMFWFKLPVAKSNNKQ